MAGMAAGTTIYSQSSAAVTGLVVHPVVGTDCSSLALVDSGASNRTVWTLWGCPTNHAAVTFEQRGLSKSAITATVGTIDVWIVPIYATLYSECSDSFPLGYNITFTPNIVVNGYNIGSAMYYCVDSAPGTVGTFSVSWTQ